MQPLTAGVVGVVSSRVARQVALLLLLAAALSGFLLLPNLLSSLVASGPEDILAVNPSEEDGIGLPTGVEFLTFSVVAVSVILGIAALVLAQRWPLRLDGSRASLPSLVGLLVAVTLIGTGIYLAYSGIMGQEISYEQHLVERSRLQPIGLAVLAGFLISCAVVGALRPALLPALLPILLLFLLAAVIFGVLALAPSDGTQLSQGTGAGGGADRIEDYGTGGAIRWEVLAGFVLFLLTIVGFLKPRLLLFLLPLLLLCLLAAILFGNLDCSPSSERQLSQNTGAGGSEGADESQGGAGDPGGRLGLAATAEGARSGLSEDSQGHQTPSEQASKDRTDTVTTITQWPHLMRRQTTFAVGGTVNTVDGAPVSGMIVEVYVNETKEHGGTRIGATETTLGDFQAEVQMPASLELGAYQILARAVPNPDYNESWSDPDITVVSSSGLEITGPSEVPVDVAVTFRGRLSEDTGEGAADREIKVTIDGSSAPPVITDGEGRFSFSESFSEPGPHWVEVAVEREDFLLDNSARLDFEVVLPTETIVSASAQIEVAREFRVTGEVLDARGDPIPGAYVSVRIGDGPEQSTPTDELGAFEHIGRLDEAGAFLVRVEFAGAPPVRPSKATARLVARHAVGLTLDVPTDLGQGGSVTLTGRVTSATLSPIGQLELTAEDAGGNLLATVATAEDGRFELSLPNSEVLLDGPVTFRYGGDDLVMPISYFLSVPTTSTGFNWPLWIGMPAAAAVAIVGSLVARRVRPARLRALLQRRPAADAPSCEQGEEQEAEGSAVEEAATAPQPVHLKNRFLNVAPDLPDVWGVGEAVAIEASLVDSEGLGVAGATVEVAVGDGGASSQLVTDDAGACTYRWTAEELGEYVVSARFAGNEGREVASADRGLRVVDFREEIVRLYNSFIDWAKERAAGVSDQSTPREMELILVDEGLQLDQKSLDELISRFEEADYSEHPIARRHYEAMYRAWHTIVRD